MLLYAGIDAHKVFCQISLHDQNMNELLNEPFATDKKKLTTFFKGLTKRGELVKIIIEVSPIGKAVARHLRKKNFPVELCNPIFNDAMARDPKKSDRRDARRLSRKALNGDFSPVHLTTERNWNLSIKYRRSLRLRETVKRKKNQIHSVLKEHFVMGADLERLLRSEKHYEAFMKKLSGKSVRELVAFELRDLRYLDEQLDMAWRETFSEANKNRAFRYLKTIPEVGGKTAAVFMAIIDDPFRFSHRRQLWDYAGLGRRGQESSGKLLRKKGFKKWNKELAWYLRKVVDRCKNKDNCLGQYYRQLAKRRKAKDAFFETARKVAEVMWGIFKNPCEFNPRLLENPQPVAPVSCDFIF